jgi:protein phosphatase
MSTLAQLAAARPGLIVATPHRVIDLGNESDTNQAIGWWSELTSNGGEGIVVKPLDLVARGKKGLLQPAMKCRGPEYLRIIYGPEYLRPGNLDRLRERGTAAKRNLALKEFALGIESLSRFVSQAPLRSVHECAFGVLALESEPIDPRL